MRVIIILEFNTYSSTYKDMIKVQFIYIPKICVCIIRAEHACRAYYSGIGGH